MVNAPRAGRWAGLLLVWTGLSYWVIVGFVTVIPKVFFPPTASMEGSCSSGLAELRTELLDRARRSLYVSSAPTDFEVWAEHWDQRYEGLYPACSTEHLAPYQILGQLRHRVETRIHRQERDILPLIQRLDQLLRAPAHPSLAPSSPGNENNR